MTTTNNCFAYTRVSTVKQGEGVSLKAQREAIENYASKHGLVISKWFEEKETAAKQGRPVFTEMIKTLHRQGSGGLVMHKIDRSARNLRDWATVGELQDRGIAVHFAAESVDFASRGGRLTADIQAVIAADYIRNLRDETLKGMRGRLKQGLYPWKAPIGYLDNGGGKPKTIDTARGPLVRQLFELYASGEHSLDTLTSQARNIGLRNRSGVLVSRRGVETILNNPFYMGLIHIKRTSETWQGVHEPLITPSLFQAVQDVKAGKHIKKKTRHEFTYRRIFKCRHCHRSITPERQKRHVYYRCHTKGCARSTTREETIERAVSRKLKSLTLPSAALPLLRKRLQRMISTNDTINETIPMRIGQIEDRQAKLLDAYLDGAIDRETFEDRKSQLLLEATQLREEQQSGTEIADLSNHVPKFFELFKSLEITYSLANSAEKRRMLENLFSNRCLSGENIELEPQNWVEQVRYALPVPVGAPEAATLRSSCELQSSELKCLIGALSCQEAQALLKIKTKSQNGF